ncbi:winged helix-turn-helix transcriptional regulator [Thermosipho ferrireducens]|uniref:Winged helix-turn-helix transcriptional regulator n=1 Tax=Thermosipho ferrireducens TaxID=2571116 RepID=A0ABX7S7R0_9BACT|nr:winged helix-turn-helix domain-containing protein [Thermosipho ferrireducens]QTA38623.1 winged helix-turn-helix transcriptional regulator [Thermosipho ferrireducens]
MLKKVDKHNGIPAYIQIINMIKAEIIKGEFQPGSQLPPVRKLQDVFDVNINTVLKALERLKNEGILEAEHGIGFFVSKKIPISVDVMKKIKECVKKLKETHIDLQTILVLFEEVWKNEN